MGIYKIEYGSRGTAPPSRGSTMATTAVTTRDEVHGTTTMAQIMPPRQVQAVQHKAHAAEATAQASHSRASRTEQPAPVTKHAPAAQPAPYEQSTHVAQPVPTEQPTFVAQPAPTEQPAHVVQTAPTARPAPVAFQAAQVGPRLSQPSGPTIEPGAFSPYFSVDLAFPNSNLAPGVYRPSTARGGTFLPSSSNPNGEQHLSRQVIELTIALAQQTTLVNQLLQRTKIQCVSNEVSRRRTRADEEPLQQRPGKQPLGQPRTERLGRVYSRLGPRDSVYSCLSARMSVHSRLGLWTGIHSRSPIINMSSLPSEVFIRG